jgi:hypothetical protein
MVTPPPVGVFTDVSTGVPPGSGVAESPEQSDEMVPPAVVVPATDPSTRPEVASHGENVAPALTETPDPEPEGPDAWPHKLHAAAADPVIPDTVSPAARSQPS